MLVPRTAETTRQDQCMQDDMIMMARATGVRGTQKMTTTMTAAAAGAAAKKNSTSEEVHWTEAKARGVVGTTMIDYAMSSIGTMHITHRDPLEIASTITRAIATTSDKETGIL